MAQPTAYLGGIVTTDRVINLALPGASAVDDALLPTTALSGLRADPNPFNPVTRIRFTLGAAGMAKVGVYGLDGRRARLLAEGRLAAGDHELTWDGRDDQGRELAQGLYFFRFQAGGKSSRAKLTVIR